MEPASTKPGIPTRSGSDPDGARPGHPRSVWSWGWLLCAVVGAGIAAASGLSGGPQRLPDREAVYVFDDAVKIGARGEIFSHASLPDYIDKNPAWDGRAVQLAGARGEVVAFQVVIRAGDRALSAVDVRASELTGQSGALPAARFERFRQWYTEVTLPTYSPAASTGPGHYPDALIPAEVPVHGLPIAVPAGRAQGVWLDLAIPADAAAGSYRGAVTALSGDQVLARFDLALEVYDFDLPRERHMRFRVGYGGFGEYLQAHEGIAYHRECGEESARFRAREAQLYRLSWSHRLAPTTHYSSPIPAHAGSGAGLVIDWTTFDQRFGAYLDGSAFDDRVPLNAFSLPVNLYSHGGWPSGTTAASAPGVADLDTAAITTTVAQTVAHWRERGWPVEHSFIYLSDEPAPERYDVLDAACRAIRAGDGRVPVTIPFFTQFGERARDIVERFTGCVTMWEIAGDYMDLPALAGRREAGDTIGFYQGFEPFQGGEVLDADGLALVTWPWIAWRYRLDTLFLYNMVEWSYVRLDHSDKPWRDRPRDIWTNPLNQSWQTNSQGVLIYPGHRVGYPGVIPSIRLKAVRRGMQDYEYLWLLAHEGHGARADELARRMIPAALHEAAPGFGATYRGPGNWPHDPRVWAAARREMARLLAD